MRALGFYAKEYHSPQAWKAVEQAAEFFLSRQLFLSRRTGKPIREEFTKLHYPLYWHYDILGALKAFAEIGFPKDPRMEPSLSALGNDYVDWGGVSKKTLNEWVTADALFILRVYGD